MNWIKEKLKRWWKWWLGILIPVAMASTLLIGESPPTLTIGTETYVFSYTDSTAGEDLIIRLPKQNFIVGIPAEIGARGRQTLEAPIFVAITNTSGVDQNVSLVALTGGKTMIAKAYEISSVTKGISELGSSRAQRPVSAKRKSAVGSEIDQTGNTLIPNGETRFFILNFRAALEQNEAEDFYLEAYGDQNGYGHSF